jgi:bacillithiol biosynthesis cysteine-adding enzyme BshC
VCEVLARQNRGWNAGEETLRNIDRLANGACAVVAGQQVGLFLGPAYTLYKAITAIRIARELSARGTEAVPIFWLASEDHDLAEVNHAVIPDGHGGLRRLQTASKGTENEPVGRVALQDVDQCIDEFVSVVGDSQLIDDLRAAYKPGKTFAEAFALLISKLFSKFGLIVMDPSDPELHVIARPIFTLAAENAGDLTARLLERTKELEAGGYHAQVKVASSSTLLFYFNGQSRLPIHRKNGHFTVGGEHWSGEELQKNVVQHPERFSANVLLRPILQDFLLPTAAYIPGPAEIAYFAQAQVVYHELLGDATPLWPRFSITLVEPRLADWMKKYGLSLRDLLRPKDDFVTDLARRTIPADLKDDFDRSQEQLERLISPLLHTLKKLDPTISAAGEIAARKMRYQLERLESRAARANLRREEILERQAAVLSSNLFPERELQERQIAGVYFVAKYGNDLIDRLLNASQPECVHHQVLSLA